MIKKYVIFLSLLNVIFGQISMSDINKLSNEQLDLIRDELRGGSDSSTINNNEIDNTETVLETVDIQTSLDVDPLNPYFGYNYFKRNINFFDNIPTPSDFKLGPGDELIISLWGETNSREKFVINKEGLNRISTRIFKIITIG